MLRCCVSILGWGVDASVCPYYMRYLFLRIMRIHSTYCHTSFASMMLNQEGLQPSRWSLPWQLWNMIGKLHTQANEGFSTIVS